jgi:hypothetical protein
MAMARKGFDPSRHKWREVRKPGLVQVRHDYTILG